MLSAEEYITGPNVLELGHGPGHLLCSLIQHGYWATGLDESWRMIQRAKKNFQKTGLKINSINGSAQHQPYKSNQFNHVVATFPSNFIINPHTLSESYRVLVPGGSLIVVPVAWITGNNLFHKLAAWLFRITGQSPTATEEFNQKWIHLLSTAGFQVRSEYLNLGSSLVLIIVATK